MEAAAAMRAEGAPYSEIGAALGISDYRAQWLVAEARYLSRLQANKVRKAECNGR
jgi:hypothetical protein